MSESNFSYNNFIIEKQNFETELNKFKTTYEKYDTSTDSSFITLQNINNSSFTLIETSSNILSNTDCKALCSANSECIAYSFIDGSCNTYKKNQNPSSDLNYIDSNININLLKNSDNIEKIGNYLMTKNNNMILIASNVMDDLNNYETDTATNNATGYFYDESDGNKLKLDENYNDLQEIQQEKRNLLATHETNVDPIGVKTQYFRYMFLFVLMFIMLTVFIYFTVDNTTADGSNFMLYLVLFVIVFSVSIIYFLQ